MLRSMYSGISGLKNFQTKLDVIGNNIANVNTHGFKKGRVVFKDLISQTSGAAAGPTITRGGVNPMQVGLGSQIAAIDTVHGTGSLQTTNNTLDLAISGDGFFMVADSTEAPSDEGIIEVTGEEAFANILYTRAGNFYRDENGYLVNAEGKYLVGVRADEYADLADEEGIILDEKPNVAGEDGANLFEDGVLTPGEGELGAIRIPISAQNMSIGQDGTVSYTDLNGELKYAGQIILTKFANTGGLEKTGANYYRPTANSGNPYAQVATVGGIGAVQSSTLEMSNVDLSEEFTEMIVAQRGFQATSRIITTSDEILQELVNLKR